MVSLIYRFAEKLMVKAPDCEYNVLFENILEKHNTRYDDPMVTLGRDYVRPACRQQITIIPGRLNCFRDNETLEAELDNELAAEFRQLFVDEPDMNMWFAKDELRYAAKYGKLI